MLGLNQKSDRLIIDLINKNSDFPERLKGERFS